MPHRNPLVFTIGVFYLILAIGAAVVIRVFDVDIVFLPRDDPRRAALGVGLGLLTALLIVFFSGIATARFDWARSLERDFRQILGPMRTSEALLVALFSGTVEELLFRGSLQPLLGPILTSLLFGLMHVGPARRYFPWTIFATVVGLLFSGFVYFGYGLVPAIIAHVLVNFLNLRRIGRELDLFAGA